MLLSAPGSTSAPDRIAECPHMFQKTSCHVPVPLPSVPVSSCHVPVLNIIDPVLPVHISSPHARSSTSTNVMNVSTSTVQHTHPQTIETFTSTQHHTETYTTRYNTDSFVENPMLALYYQNSRGLNSKIQSFLLNVSSSNFDVIILTETWLKASVNDSELFGGEFLVHRCDRSSVNSGRSHGGGVLVAVNKHIPSSRIFVRGCECLEIVLVKIIYHGSTIFIACIYVPPHCSSDMNTKIVEVLSSFFEEFCISPSDTVICVGDFNLNKLSWLRHDDIPSVLIACDTNRSSSNIIDCMSCNALYQMNTIFNFMNRILDLFFCSDPHNVNLFECSSPLSIVDKYHKPLEIHVILNSSTLDSSDGKTERYDYKKADYHSLNVFLRNVDWISLFHNCDVQLSVSNFYEILNVGILLCVPSKILCSSNKPPWFTKDLITIRNRKNKAYKRYKTSLSYSDYCTYSLLRSDFKRQQSIAYKEYLSRTQSNLVSNPSKFWSYVNSKLKSSGIPSLMNYKNEIANSPKDIAQLFRSYFSSVYCTPPTSVNSNSHIKSHMHIGDISLPESIVFEGLMNLDSSKGCGPDGIPPVFLVNCAQSLCRPITIIFNLSLESGIFPDIWKTSCVKPIFKSGPKNSVENYRPICLLSSLGKLFES